MKKIIISAEVLKKALEKLSHAVNAKGILPITTFLLCKVEGNTITMVATNTEVTILYKVECESKEDGQFLLPFDFIQKIVAYNPNFPIEIEAGVKKVKVKADNDVYEAKLFAKPDDFPQLPEIDNTNAVLVSDHVLSSLHRATLTVKNSNALTQLTNVLLELGIGKITVASTDGSYMVYTQEFDIDNQKEAALLISVKSITALHGLTDVQVSHNESFTCFTTKDVTVINTRTQDKFADFRRVFPQDWPENLTINKSVLSEALAKTSMATDDLKSATFTISADKIKIESYDAQFKVNLDVEALYNGTVPIIAVRYDKLQKMLSQIDAVDIQLAIHDHSKAIVLTSKDVLGYKGMVMPIAQSK
jgi:DNA polymerase III subunit beta